MQDSAPRPDEMRSLPEFLCFAIYSASHAFNRVYKVLLAPLGLRYLAMVALWETDGQTVGSLGGKLSLVSSTLTPLLKRLEAAGLIERSRDAIDERQVRVRLTAGGKALCTRALGVPDSAFQATGLTKIDALRPHREISSVRDALERHPKRAEKQGLSLAEVG